MYHVLLLGSGKIGRMIAKFLAGAGDYDVLVADRDSAALARAHRQSSATTASLDATNAAELARLMRGRQAVISALSFRFNPLVAEVAREQGLSYFDLTEDVETTAKVRQIADERARRADLRAAVRPGARVRLDRRQPTLPRVRRARHRAHARRRAAAVSHQRAEVQPDLVHRRPDQRVLQPVRGDPRRAADRGPAAGGPRAVLARRRALRGLQHVRRRRHALRNARRQSPRAELQDDPLPRPPRPGAPSWSTSCG